MKNKKIKDMPHDVVDYHGNVVTTADNEKLAKIMVKHFSYSEPQMTTRPSKA
jgi:hypothetical protein